MDDLYYEVLLAKEGDIIANKKIVERYKKYILFMINRYGITDKNTCYDEVANVLLKAIQKINL